jgi:hypothetical protein
VLRSQTPRIRIRQVQAAAAGNQELPSRRRHGIEDRHPDAGCRRDLGGPQAGGPGSDHAEPGAHSDKVRSKISIISAEDRWNRKNCQSGKLVGRVTFNLPITRCFFDSARKTLDAGRGFVKYPAIHPAGGVILFL